MKIKSKFAPDITINYHLPCKNSASGWNLELNGKALSPRECIEPEKEHSNLRDLVMAEASDLVWPIPMDKENRRTQKIKIETIDGENIVVSFSGTRVAALQRFKIYFVDIVKKITFDINNSANY